MNEDTQKRSRGGQPGNTNALKHGFYASKLPAEQLADIDDDFQFDGLNEEIVILRLYARRIVELSAQVDNPKDAVTILRALTSASTGITRLIRTNYEFKEII